MAGQMSDLLTSNEPTTGNFAVLRIDSGGTVVWEFQVRRQHVCSHQIVILGNLAAACLNRQRWLYVELGKALDQFNIAPCAADPRLDASVRTSVLRGDPPPSGSFWSVWSVICRVALKQRCSRARNPDILNSEYRHDPNIAPAH